MRYSCRILFDYVIVSESKWPRVQRFYLLSSSFNSFQLKTSRCWSPLILKITFYLFSLGSGHFYFSNFFHQMIENWIVSRAHHMDLSFSVRKLSEFSETLRLVTTVTSRNWWKATSGNEVVMAKIDCHSLLSGSSWSSFEEDSPMEEPEGLYSYCAFYLSPQLCEKTPRKLFSGDLPCVILSTIAMEVDENNGLGSVEATRLHQEGNECDF